MHAKQQRQELKSRSNSCRAQGNNTLARRKWGRGCGVCNGGRRGRCRGKGKQIGEEAKWQGKSPLWHWHQWIIFSWWSEGQPKWVCSVCGPTADATCQEHCWNNETCEMAALQEMLCAYKEDIKGKSIKLCRVTTQLLCYVMKCKFIFDSVSDSWNETLNLFYQLAISLAFVAVYWLFHRHWQPSTSTHHPQPHLVSSRLVL